MTGDGEAPFDVCLPVGPLLCRCRSGRRKACLIHREYEHGTPLGIWLAPEDDLAEIAADLDDFTVIAVHFQPMAALTARLLRERHGYDGELRLRRHGRDQIFFLNRVGFDAFVIGGANAEDAQPLTIPELSGQCGAAALFRRRAA